MGFLSSSCSVLVHSCFGSHNLNIHELTLQLQVLANNFYRHVLKFVHIDIALFVISLWISYFESK